MKLADALQDLVRDLREQGAAFAVVGGLAASARGEVRFTRDVDVAVAVGSDEAAEALLFGLSRGGYVVVATVEQEATSRLATARLRHRDGIVCDLAFATSGIEGEVVRGAEELELFPGLLVPTASPAALLAMKTLSASPQRPRDLEDIRAILAANPALCEAEVTLLLEAIQARGYARGQDLLEKWGQLLARFRGP